MSRRDSGDDDNPRRPLEDSAAVSVGETAAPLTKGLPWQFWVWQCMPMVMLILVMPPGENPEWWIHTPVITWIEQQEWSELLPFFVFNTWFCQGILLAYWMVWGNGFWGYRIFKVLGLGVLAASLPAIWFLRHFQLFVSGLNPWSEVFNPIALSLFFLSAVGCSFLPAVIVMGAMYWRGYRMTVVELPSPSLKRWQFSLWGLTVLTFVCSVVLAFFNWFYPVLVSLAVWLVPAEKPYGDWDTKIILAASSAFSSLLVGVIMIGRKWQVTATVFAFLTIFRLLGSVVMSLDFMRSGQLRWPDTLFFAVSLALGNMISLAITRYCIGRDRLILTCRRPEPLPSPAASKDVL
ncbi:MAG: hypothetical protein ACO1RA_01035 [Planctomycetaceae bacterium]